MNTITERIRVAKNLIDECEESVCNLRAWVEEQQDEFDENGCFSNKNLIENLISCERSLFFFILDVWGDVHMWLDGIDNTETLLSRADACLEAVKRLTSPVVHLECCAIRTGLIEAND